VEGINELTDGQHGGGQWNDGERRKKLEKFVVAMNDFDITPILALANDCGGTFVPSCPEQRWRDECAFYEEMRGRGRKFIASPLSEFSSEAAFQFVLIFGGIFHGRKMWNNEGGRPNSKPGDYEFYDYHTGTQGDLGPGGWINLNNTDSGILGWIQNGDPRGKANIPALKEWLKNMLVNGRSANYFSYLATLDKNAAKAIGEVLVELYGQK
jgi:hypothetical protein